MSSKTSEPCGADNLCVGDTIKLTPLQQMTTQIQNRRIQAAHELALMCGEEIRRARKDLWDTVRGWYPEADGFELRLVNDGVEIYAYRIRDRG